MSMGQFNEKEEREAPFLPQELLEIIFESAVQHDAPTQRTRYTYRTAPINISMVSRHWRNVALNAPKLWSSITVSYPVNLRKGGRATHLTTTSHVPLFLERSRVVHFSLIPHLIGADDSEGSVDETDEEGTGEGDEGREVPPPTLLIILGGPCCYLPRIITRLL